MFLQSHESFSRFTTKIKIFDFNSSILEVSHYVDYGWIFFYFLVVCLFVCECECGFVSMIIFKKKIICVCCLLYERSLRVGSSGIFGRVSCI